MLGDVLEPSWLGVTDEQPENAVAPRRVTDPGALLRRDAPGDELDEPLAVAADDAQGAVARVDECRGRLDDPSEDLGQVQVGTHRDDGVEELAHPVLGLARRAGPCSQLVDQVVQIKRVGTRPRRRDGGRLVW